MLGTQPIKNGFSLPQYVQDSFGYAEKTGMYLDVSLFGVQFISTQLWDFTHSATAAQRINYHLAKLTIEPSQLFAFFAERLLSISFVRWLGWFINAHVGLEYPATFFQWVTHQLDDYFNPATAGIHPQDREKLKARAAGYARHQQDWEFIKHNMTVFLQQEPAIASLCAHLSASDDYVFHSSDALIHITVPALSDAAQLIASEQHSLWWRYWLANSEHVQAYEAHLNEWQHWVDGEKQKCAQSAFARLQAAMLTHNVESDDAIYLLLQATRDKNIHRRNLKKYPVRQGMTSALLSQLDRTVQQFADETLLEEYQVFRAQHASLFLSLGSFTFSDSLEACPTALVPYIPTYRLWPEGLFAEHNARYDFFHQPTPQRVQLHQRSLELPWIASAIRQVAQPFSEPLTLSMALIEQIDAALSQSPPTSSSGWSWFSTTHHDFITAWRQYLTEQRTRALDAVVEHAVLLHARAKQERLVTPDNLPQVIAYLDALRAAQHANAPYWSAEQSSALEGAVNELSSRVEALQKTPAHQHAQVDQLMQAAVNQNVLSTDELTFLTDFYHAGPFSLDDYPGDSYAQDHGKHQGHYHGYIKLLAEVVQTQATAVLSGALDERLQHLAVMKTSLQLLALMDEQQLLLPALANTLRTCVIELIQQQVNGTFTVVEQHQLLQAIDAVADVSPHFSTIKLQVAKLHAVVHSDRPPILKLIDVKAAAYVLEQESHQLSLLSDIRAAQEVVSTVVASDDAPMIKLPVHVNLFTTTQTAYTAIQQCAQSKDALLAYLASQLQYVKEEATSIKKIEDARAELQTVFGFFQSHALSHHQPPGTESLFSRPYTITVQ